MKSIALETARKAPEKYLTILQAATAVGVGYWTLRRMSDAGEYPALVLVGARSLRVPAAAHEKWMAANRKPKAPRKPRAKATKGERAAA